MKSIRALAGYLVAGICLFWVFHDIQFGQMWRGMVHVHWWLMALCVILEFLAYFCVAWEWQLLLRPAGSISLWKAAQAVFAGRFANDALPFQLGYLARAILAAQWMDVEIVSIFPSLIVERLWDGLWLAAGIGLAAVCVPLPPAALHAARFLGAIMLAGTAATALAVLRRSGTVDRPIQTRSKLIQGLRRAFQRLVSGVRDIVQSGLLLAVIVLSLLKLAIQAAAFLCLLWAYGLHLGISIGLTVFLAGYLGICVPSTPGGAGMFQLFVVASLALFGVGKSTAAGFALNAFITITVPLAVSGFFALAHSRLRLRQIRAQAGKLNYEL